LGKANALEPGGFDGALRLVLVAVRKRTGNPNGGVFYLANSEFNSEFARMIERQAEVEIREQLRHYPTVALLGPRQVGETLFAVGLCVAGDF